MGRRSYREQVQELEALPPSISRDYALASVHMEESARAMRMAGLGFTIALVGAMLSVLGITLGGLALLLR